MGGPSSALRLFGAVFAGGRSGRMGRDKAVLAWPAAGGGETTLYERAAETLALVCERVEVSVGTEGRIVDPAWPVFLDRLAGQGPLAGLLAALERAEELGLDAALALACDMPLVGATELQPLIDALGEGTDGAPGADVALWVVEGREQPLCAAYRTTCTLPVRRAFDGGARRLVSLLDEEAPGGRELRVIRIVAEKNSTCRLVNVNTQTDYDRALREASHRPSPHDR